MALRLVSALLLILPVLACDNSTTSTSLEDLTSTSVIESSTTDVPLDTLTTIATLTTTPTDESTTSVETTTSITDSTINPTTSIPPVPTTTITPTTTVCSSLTINPTNSAIPELPNPFQFVDGSQVMTKDDWACHRDEISQLMQWDELGVKPPKPDVVNGTLSGNSLVINVSQGNKSISFTVGVSYPSTGTAPYPAIIAYGGMSIPTPAGVAILTFNNDDMGAQNDQSSRGQGKFFTLYGENHSAGAMMAWAWGVSRIIDVLESIPNTRINLSKIAVTGCSRNGKGALVAGAFDDRIALTIPQESGSGGSACWRLSDYQMANGETVQTASEIVQENVWFSTSFNNFSTSVNQLPFDHHSLAGLVAPRGLFVIENTGMEWLGNFSCYGCMVAGHAVYEALGVPDSMGFSQVGNHNHCQFPSSQQGELTAFINKFLFGQTTNTTVFRTDGGFSLNKTQWMPWAIPDLS